MSTCTPFPPVDFSNGNWIQWKWWRKSCLKMFLLQPDALQYNILYVLLFQCSQTNLRLCTAAGDQFVSSGSERWISEQGTEDWKCWHPLLEAEDHFQRSQASSQNPSTGIKQILLNINPVVKALCCSSGKCPHNIKTSGLYASVPSKMEWYKHLSVCF